MFLDSFDHFKHLTGTNLLCAYTTRNVKKFQFFQRHHVQKQLKPIDFTLEVPLREHQFPKMAISSRLGQ